ncbi:MAG: DNA-binding response regulator [Aeromicrobium sp.]|jgi:DNA-binding response OmpR family regulator|nr:DNA-binding response regulator [Aeromicrobium sp.]
MVESMALGDRPHVLVIEDDPAICDVLQRHLEEDAYDVTVAVDGPSGIAAAHDLEPDLIVLDHQLPRVGGVDVCQQLRQTEGLSVPIILLTTPNRSGHDFTGLTSGADDYVAKPFSAAELTLRVGSVLRRSLVPAGPRPVAGLLIDGDLTLNPVSREALQDGARLPLTTREFDLLHFLLRHPGRVFSADDLLTQVWGWDYRDQSTVAVHVGRIRHHVEPEPAAPRRLVTVDDSGYRWDPAPREA